MRTMGGSASRIQGTVAPGYESVRDMFAANFDKGYEEHSQGWKFMSCSHGQELCQQASWLLIGYK